MIVERTLAGVNAAAVVEVLVLHVAGAVVEAVHVLKAALVGHAGSVDPRTVCILAYEVAFLKVAVGLEAPDIAVVLTCGIAARFGSERVEQVVGVVPGGHLRAGV